MKTAMAIFIALGIVATSASGGESKADRRLDRMGITIHGANKNSALIRQYESRKIRKIEKQPAPVYGEIYVYP